MSLLVGAVVILLILNTSEQIAPSILPDTYKDVFIPGSGRKPALGTSSSTCWARGGICVDIAKCPGLKMDVSVPGCAWGYKVCCIVHRLLSPTVGTQRRAIPTIGKLEDLGSMLMTLAQKNSIAMNRIGGMDQDHTEEEMEHIDVESRAVF